MQTINEDGSRRGGEVEYLNDTGFFYQQELNYPHNTNHVTFVQAEKKIARRNVQHHLEFPGEKDKIIESLRRRVQEYERRNKEYEDSIHRLQSQLASSSGQAEVFGLMESDLPSLPDASSSTSSSNASGGMSLRPSKSRTSLATSAHSPPDLEVIGALRTLNSAIVATATSLSSKIQYNHLFLTVPDRKDMDGMHISLTRSSWVIGERMSNLLLSEPLPTESSNCDPPLLLTQIVFEAVFAKWCGLILGYNEEGARGSGVEAYHWRQEVYDLRSAPTNSDKWFSSIMDCVRDVTFIAGWAFKPSHTHASKISLSPIITAIHSLQHALDKLRDASQDIEVHLAKPGLRFTAATKTMVDAFSEKRPIFRLKRRPSTSNQAIATTALGLKWVDGREDTPILVPPQIVLERTFLDAFSSSNEPEEPQVVKIRVGGGRSAAVSSVKVRAPHVG